MAFVFYAVIGIDPGEINGFISAEFREGNKAEQINFRLLPYVSNLPQKFPDEAFPFSSDFFVFWNIIFLHDCHTLI
jgi:hypothetical protein